MDDIKGLRLDTPVETYSVKGKDVLVKRDDLMGDGIHLPPWGKIEALRRIVKHELNKNRPLIHLSVYGSWTSWALSSICKFYDIEYIMAYPDVKHFPKKQISIVEANGGKICPLKANVMNIQYNQVRNIAKKEGYQLLPYAFDHFVYIDYISERFREVKEQYPNIQHLVVSSGAGVTCLGMLKEHRPWTELWEGYNDRTFHTVCMSNEKTIKEKFMSHGINPSSQIEIVDSEYEFNDFMKWYETPFPCNEHWDKKTWYWLEKNIDKMTGTVLYWNIGGNVDWQSPVDM